MILDGLELRQINKIVDLYNYISIKHIIPVGGDDLNKIEGNISLKYAIGDEAFIGINSREKSNPKVGEIVYVDDKEVLCRRWNWRECNKTKMTEKTTNVSIVTEGLPPITKEDIEAIIKEIRDLVYEYCGGNIKTIILNKTLNEFEI